MEIENGILQVSKETYLMYTYKLQYVLVSFLWKAKGLANIWLYVA